MALTKWAYLFEEGDSSMRDLLGSKGAYLAEMRKAGLPIPPGFTITTQACTSYYEAGEKFPEGMWMESLVALQKVEEITGKKFGGTDNPLLVSVRSGAKFSMPALMDTVLNLGLNDETRAALARLTGNERFSYDIYHRFIQLFGKVVLGIDSEKFEHQFDEYKKKLGVREDTEVIAEALAELIENYKAIVKKETGKAFPTDPFEQLQYAIKAVFASWNGRRARDYRRINKISDDLGTAVNVQTMVFGNMGEDSGTGVAFTRDVATGEKVLYGEYLQNAQGEDVFAGVRTPKMIADLKEVMPEVYDQFQLAATLLENYYGNVVETEFVIEQGKLWIMQSRNAKRTSIASVRFILDFLREYVITKRQAVIRLRWHELEKYFIPKLPKDINKQPLTIGIPASPGAATGAMVISHETAERMMVAGEKFIFVHTEVSPEHFHIMIQSQGVLTTRRGLTSHAAIVCRGMDKPCVTGAVDLQLDNLQNHFSASKETIREGDVITIDGHSGRVFKGKIDFIRDSVDEEVIQEVTSLIWNVKTTDFYEDGLGNLWLLRDIVKDKAALQFSMFNHSARKLSNQSTKGKRFRRARYTSFIQPSDDITDDILRAIHWDLSEDTCIIAWGVAYNLLRQLQNAIGIGNHHLAIRSLIDPEKALFRPKTRSRASSEELSLFRSGMVPLYQLVGIEFFGISRFLRNTLPWANVQWWGVVNITNDLGSAWHLDKTNPNGESLVQGSTDLVGFLMILDGERLDIQDTRKWYDEFRERELGWSWYRQNNLSWAEIVGILQQIQPNKVSESDKLTILQHIGLIDNDFCLTPKGESLLNEQTASSRRYITFQERELNDEQ
jgi:phosphohistidine swiveling domain-containing protein